MLVRPALTFKPAPSAQKPCGSSIAATWPMTSATRQKSVGISFAKLRAQRHGSAERSNDGSNRAIGG